MANMNVYDVREKMHKMRAKLYPNYLPGQGGTFIARTDSESSATIEDICAAMKKRGGYDGSYEDALQTVRHFFMETVYQLCDGFAINLGFFTIHPNIGGVFQSDKEAHDHKKHPISFRFQPLKALRDFRQSIDVIIEGVAATQGYIDKFIDFDEHATNSLYAHGDQFALTGHKIKVAGNDPGNGVFVVPVDDPSKAVKVTRPAENTAGKITGIMPRTGFRFNRIEVRTQYTGAGNRFLKVPRVITSSFILEEC